MSLNRAEHSSLDSVHPGLAAPSPDLTVYLACAQDLDQITSTIASAVEAWPAPPRLKRCVVPVLTYDEVDLEDHEILVVSDTDRIVAAGTWRLKPGMVDPHGRHSTLLHGLFVAKETQQQGLGRWLQTAIARRAHKAGFHGLHVKAERFAAGYFSRCGYRRLDAAEQPGNDRASYPHWFWQDCERIAEARWLQK